MCFELRNYIRRKRKLRAMQMLHGKVNRLYAFDFDHTLVEKNSDSVITDLLKESLPDEIINFYTGKNWVAYMDKIMKYMGSQGIDIEQIRTHIKSLEFVTGMEKLLQQIRNTRERDATNHFIVISDSNDFFISTVFSKLTPSVEPNKVFTNRALLPVQTGIEPSPINYMKIRPFEEQRDCKLCPRNLCKGKALTKYMMTEGPFSHVYYVGDGLNDVCPALYLGPDDTLFVRRGYALEQVLIEKRLGECPVILNCKVVYWNTGDDVAAQMEFGTKKNIKFHKESGYAD